MKSPTLKLMRITGYNEKSPIIYASSTLAFRKSTTHYIELEKREAGYYVFQAFKHVRGFRRAWGVFLRRATKDLYFSSGKYDKRVYR